ncbi:defensin-like [Temnothorax americanus]|uniref:defensin-like n=1 Tax=Temnothorax americanus TaxID=1964332 RepID=UPI004067C3BA
MKIYVFALLVVAAVTFARQLTVEDEVPLDILDLPLASENKSSPIELHHRERRFTCSHNACNAHCIVRNRKGGYCNGKGLCVCRK